MMITDDKIFCLGREGERYLWVMAILGIPDRGLRTKAVGYAAKLR